MNKITLVLLSFCFASLSFGQSNDNDKLIELGKAYKNFMFRNEAPKDFIENLQSNTSENLKLSSAFIIQTIKTDNDLLKQPYLTLPDSQSLKYIYIIRAINHNVREENQMDNNKLIDSLKSTNISKNELVNCYYALLFTGVGNKIKPFDFSKIDFKMNEYNLKNETEKGIFFLQCMDLCGKNIWGYMNVVRPPNTKKAMDFIKKFPKFNGLFYYQYTDLNFPDFEIVFLKGEEKQSYKSYYLDKYYELLLNHLTCLKSEGAKDKVVNDLLLGSILKDKNLYKYSKQQERLEGLFD